MALLATPIESVLVVAYQVGLTDTGAPKIRQRSIANVRSNALDQDVYDVAGALFSLQEFPVTSIRRDNRIDLVNE
ncbi:DUF1659 domain-containing protein [Desulfitobacterium sp. THU1]|uniref:DUF1659 domain-containing protein n=1 Tax=Desulfitobacterium sp. THU1 TaxID=3138072 RepID=UPI00311EB2A0